MLKARRGQVVVLVALTISLLILSTQVYVYQRSQRVSSSERRVLSDYVLNINQGSRHVVVASLINITRGGATSVLGRNLDRWIAFVSGDYQLGRCDLNATKENQSPYTEGVWLDWSTPGRGVSSACVEFNLNISGRGLEVESALTANITTTLLLSGWFVRGSGNIKQVTVIVRLLNEGEPALANSIELRYYKQDSWHDPSILPSYSHMDFGNGTSRYSFTDEIPGMRVRVRARVYDRRGIFVQAEKILTAA